MKKGSFYSVLIAIVLITISFTGCFINDDSNNEDNNMIDITHYEVYLNTTENINYTIYLPIPFKQNNYYTWISKIITNLTIEGNASYEIINTTFGKAMKIIGHNSVHLLNHFESDDIERMEYNYDELTLRSNRSDDDPETVFYYLFSNISSNDLKLDFHTYSKNEVTGDYYGYTNFEWEIKNYSLQYDWQETNMYKEWIHFG